MANGPGFYIIDPNEESTWDAVKGLYLEVLERINDDEHRVLWHKADGSLDRRSEGTWCINCDPRLLPVIPPWAAPQVDEGL